MNALYEAYALTGLTLLVLVFTEGWARRHLWLSGPLFATLVGVLVGPHGIGLLDPRRWPEPEFIVEELANLALAVSLVGVALRLPDTWVLRHWRPLALVLGLGMPAMWLIAGLCGWLLLDLPLWPALLLGAILAPTDPVLADTVVTGELAESALEPDLRHLISAESGANDGLAFLLVMLPVLLLDAAPGEALREWSVSVLLGTVLGSILGGLAVGWCVARLLIYLKRTAYGHHGTLLGVTLALSVALLGAAQSLKGEGILAVFAAGLALNYLLRRQDWGELHEYLHEHDSVKQLFETPLFLFFGMVAPFDAWLALGVPLLAYATAVLLLRRVPVLLALYPWLGPVRNLRGALFMGWFGPIGVAAMVYAAWAEVHEGYEELWTIASLVIFLSIIVHGLSATPLTRLYARLAR